MRRRVAALSETPEDTTERLATPDDVYRHVIQHVLGDGVERDSGKARVEDPEDLLTVGTDQTGGGPDHHALLLDSAPILTRAGIDVSVREASGTDPDALGTAAPLEEQVAESVVEQLTGGGEARIEASKSTGEGKPAADAKHALQAAAEGRRCITLVRPGIAHRVAQTLLGEPRYCRRTVEEDGETFTQFYNLGKLYAGGDVVKRPGERVTEWYQDDAGTVYLRDETGTQYAEYETPGAVFSASAPHPEGGERTVRAPVIPEHVLDGADNPVVSIIVVPEDAEVFADLELVVDADGTRVPLDAVAGDGRVTPPSRAELRRVG